MTLKKLVFYLLIAFVVFFVIQWPGEAAKMAKGAGDWLSTAFYAFSRFVKSLV